MKKSKIQEELKVEVSKILWILVDNSSSDIYTSSRNLEPDAGKNSLEGMFWHKIYDLHTIVKQKVKKLLNE